LPGRLPFNPTAALGVCGFEYRSSFTFLGLPLIHIRSGPGADGQRHAAKGWIALGRTAYGALFAVGAIAVAPVAIGATGVGILAIGGVGIGMVAFGGLSGGVWAMGGLSVGAFAWGGFAAGWLAAAGGAAWSHYFALGGAAAAQHANDPLARAAIHSSFFFRHIIGLFTVSMICSWLPMIGISLYRRWLKNRATLT